MKSTEVLLIWFAKVCSLTLLAVLYATFIVAYFGDVNMVIVTMNDFGEGTVEFVILSVTVALIVAGYVYEWRAGNAKVL